MENIYVVPNSQHLAGLIDPSIVIQRLDSFRKVHLQKLNGILSKRALIEEKSNLAYGFKGLIVVLKKPLQNSSLTI